MRIDWSTEVANLKLRGLLKEYNILQHLNTSYCPGENSKTERFRDILN